MNNTFRFAGRLPLLSSSSNLPAGHFNPFSRPALVFQPPVQVRTIRVRKPSSKSQGDVWPEHSLRPQNGPDPIWEEATGEQKDGGRRIAIAVVSYVTSYHVRSLFNSMSIGSNHASALASKAYSIHEPGDLIPEKERSLMNRTFAYFGGRARFDYHIHLVSRAFCSSSSQPPVKLDKALSSDFLDLWHSLVCWLHAMYLEYPSGRGSFETYVLDEYKHLARCDSRLFARPEFCHPYVSATAKTTTNLISQLWLCPVATVAAFYAGLVLLPAGLRALTASEVIRCIALRGI
ncbi:hypothetical protein Moror_13159 [Moniliophthora roreri MCA 2997]|uniref:Uncharacterized protein n=1 Tax=Moniliophthora roreri (strain MCA 2997) TaxID=1381753 RepID=V2X932_MONRO|nr:hypothetical protein Moror_13159 [Moniliophthora roreri MCA 2997]